MCTRLSISTPGPSLAVAFDADGEFLVDGEPMPPRYNVAPTDPLPALRAGAEGRRCAETLRWGLVPFWASDVSIGNRLLNARRETVSSKPAFRAAFKERRCLVLATGFYEWRTENGIKQPYLFHRRDGSPFALAGLWASWGAKVDQGEPVGVRIESCTVITMESAGAMREIHSRMPAVVPASDYDAWIELGRDRPDALHAILDRSNLAGTEEFEFYPVGRYVSNVRNKGPECIEPLQIAKQGDLF